MDNHAEDGRPGLVWLVCSFYPDPLCALTMVKVRIFKHVNRIYSNTFSYIGLDDHCKKTVRLILAHHLLHILQQKQSFFLLLVYFVSAAGCHCFDLYELDGFLCMVDHWSPRLPEILQYFSLASLHSKVERHCIFHCSLHPG